MDPQQEKALRQLVADESFADEVVKRVDALNAKAANDPTVVHKDATFAPIAPVVPPATPTVPPVAVTQSAAPVQPAVMPVTNVAPVPAVPAVPVAPVPAAPASPPIDLMATLRAAGLAPGHQSSPTPLAPAPVVPPVAQPVQDGVPQAVQVLNPVQQLEVLAGQFKSTHPEVSAQLATLVGTLGQSNGTSAVAGSEEIRKALAEMRTGLEAIGGQVEALQTAGAPMGALTPPTQAPAATEPVATVTKAAAMEYPKVVQSMANRMMGRS